eukprot:scaffold1596_cov302-Pinguiococcus_pyrenoidosus.AAC.58
MRALRHPMHHDHDGFSLQRYDVVLSRDGDGRFNGSHPEGVVVRVDRPKAGNSFSLLQRLVQQV